MMIHHGRCGSSVVGNLLVQNPNIHWASELYSSMLAKWQEENQQINFHLAKEPIVENPIAILKNSISETTKPYYGFEIKPFHFSLINSSATSLEERHIFFLLATSPDTIWWRRFFFVLFDQILSDGDDFFVS